MRFNAAKCNIMRVSGTRDPKLFNYSLTGQVLEEVMDAKYLGVTLSNDLEWSKHIATMTNNANFKLSFLRRNLNGCSEKHKQTAYISLIRSFMGYDATVWDPYQKYNSDKARLILSYNSINGLAQVSFEGVKLLRRIRKLEENTTCNLLFLTTAATQQTFPHSHNRHKNIHAPYSHIYCL